MPTMYCCVTENGDTGMDDTQEMSAKSIVSSVVTEVLHSTPGIESIFSLCHSLFLLSLFPLSLNTYVHCIARMFGSRKIWQTWEIIHDLPF